MARRRPRRERESPFAEQASELERIQERLRMERELGVTRPGQPRPRPPSRPRTGMTIGPRNKNKYKKPYPPGNY